MDEPLSALDHESKQDILPYLERLHDNLAIPVLYVSHSPDEVARLADRIVLLDAGHVRAEGSASEILARLDLPLAHDIEASSVVEGTVEGHDDELTRVAIPGGRLFVMRLDRGIGANVRVRIHARDVSIALHEPGPSSILNILPARIRETQDDERGQVIVKLTTGGHGQGETPLLARITRHSRERLGLRPGQSVFAQIKAVALVD